MKSENDPPEKLIKLNLAVKAAKERATSARAKLGDTVPREAPGHGAAQGGGKTGQRGEGK